MDDLIFVILFSTHGIRVRRSNGVYYCTKYTDTSYDFETYDDISFAMEYITEPPPSIGWHVEVSEVE